MDIALPGGAAAVLWEKGEIPHGRRKPLLGMAMEHKDTQLGVRELDLAVRCLVRSWTVRGPGGQVLPTPWENEGILDELPADVVDALYSGVSGNLAAVVPEVGDPKSAGSSTKPATPA